MPTQHLLKLNQDSCRVSAWQRFKIKWQLLYAPQARLLQTLKNWSCWATTGVPVNKQALLTTISSFLPPQFIQAANNLL